MTTNEIINEINRLKEQKRTIIDEMEKMEYKLGRKLKGQAKHYYNVQLNYCNKMIDYGRNKLVIQLEKERNYRVVKGE